MATSSIAGDDNARQHEPLVERQNRAVAQRHYARLVKSIELFAGAGGLALGAELAGFKAQRVVEWDRWACDTMRENKSAGFPLVADWNIFESDVRKVDWTDLSDPIDLVTGGPPCQPFSSGGKARAADDSRDMFPAAIEVIRSLRPRAFILENVRGLTRSAFANYYHYIQLQLRHPELESREDESWLEHHGRLQIEDTSRQSESHLTYNVVPTLVNAADYGIPQQRHRIFLVGFRSDLEAEWNFPTETHSYESLLYDQWVSGEYWDRHGISKASRGEMPGQLKSRVSKIQRSAVKPKENPWKTVRDAISDLPNPSRAGSDSHFNHTHQPGARSYKGHTGSSLDAAAKALKAGAHGVPGGENMLLNPDGSVRYFTVRESARLQTFPDEYELHGAWGEAMRQIGNAVPVQLAKIVASSVSSGLHTAAMN